MLNNQQEKMLTVSLDAVKEGIKAGKQKGFSGTAHVDMNSVVRTLIELPTQLFHPIDSLKTLAPLVGREPTGSMRELDREIRDTNYIHSMRNPKTQKRYSKDEANRAVKNVVSKQLNDALSLYIAYFRPYIEVIDPVATSGGQALTPTAIKLGLPSGGTAVTPDMSELTELSMLYNSADNPMDITLKSILPILRTKFDAISSYSNVDFKAIIKSGLDGPLSNEDAEALSGLYRAILEWYLFLKSLQADSVRMPQDSGPQSDAGEEQGVQGGIDSKEDAPMEADGATGTTDANIPTFEEILEDLWISSVRNPKDGFVLDPANGSTITIDANSISEVSAPSFDILLGGPLSKYVNITTASSDEYVESFISKNIIKINNEVLRLGSWNRYIHTTTKSSYEGGSVISLFFNPDVLKRFFDVSGGENADIAFISITVKNSVGEEDEFVITAEDQNVTRQLYKLSSSGQSTPYYETISPSGKKVYFTPADIVRGGGKVKDSNGKAFKPTRWKGKSLADKVMSKGFGGKVRGVRKNEKK
tara:strand:+ start:5714 stop:7309 length:1596 start_codon:yes stop_codon:yes gene_type:complete